MCNMMENTQTGRTISLKYKNTIASQFYPRKKQPIDFVFHTLNYLCIIFIQIYRAVSPNKDKTNKQTFTFVILVSQLILRM